LRFYEGRRTELPLSPRFGAIKRTEKKRSFLQAGIIRDRVVGFREQRKAPELARTEAPTDTGLERRGNSGYVKGLFGERLGER